MLLTLVEELATRSKGVNYFTEKFIKPNGGSIQVQSHVNVSNLRSQRSESIDLALSFVLSHSLHGPGLHLFLISLFHSHHLLGGISYSIITSLSLDLFLRVWAGLGTIITVGLGLILRLLLLQFLHFLPVFVGLVNGLSHKVTHLSTASIDLVLWLQLGQIELLLVANHHLELLLSVIHVVRLVFGGKKDLQVVILVPTVLVQVRGNSKNLLELLHCEVLLNRLLEVGLDIGDSGRLALVSEVIQALVEGVLQVDQVVFVPLKLERGFLGKCRLHIRNLTLQLLLLPSFLLNGSLLGEALLLKESLFLKLLLSLDLGESSFLGFPSTLSLKFPLPLLS